MRILPLAVAALFLAPCFGQPASLTLRAKLRDFKDFRPGDSTTHPDFENDAYMDCGGDGLGYVSGTLATTGTADTAQFRGDDRTPVLQRLVHPAKGTPCFTSIERFGDWYDDKPAVNRRFYTDIVLTRNAQGLYVFNDDNFLPLNTGAGWGKFLATDPDPFGPRPDITPNDVWGFTMELHTNFTYTAGAGQVFSFKGDDDVWVFINGRLAIDLGGLHPSLTATVNLDTRAAALGLVDGASYPLDFFFAERHSTGSHCQITTSLQLVQKTALPEPVATPPGRTFRDSIQVALTVPGHPDAQIRYTVDNSEPTETSPVYSTDLRFTATTTLKAKAFKADFLPSATRAETYTREQVALPTPVATPPGQAFRGTIQVTLAVPGHPDADIRYTLDGSEPGPASPWYAGPISLASSDTVKARAFQPGWLPSGVATEIYTLEIPPNVISMRMDSAVHRSNGAVLVQSGADLRRPIAVVSVDAGNPICLDCPPSTQDVVLQPGALPEWTVVSRDPFRYLFHIYDHLGQFVLSQQGTVGREMLDKVPGNAEGYRVLRFRWIPAALDGRSVGTGAYILRARVMSETPAAQAAKSGPSEAVLFRTFGYLRRD